MSKKDIKRFGFHEVTAGKHKGSLHYAGERYIKFLGELGLLSSYLERRIVPAEPEEVYMRSIILNLQNVLEQESEELIRFFVRGHGSNRMKKIVRAIDEGFVSFGSKSKWLKDNGLIDAGDLNILEEIRILRNNLVHSRPRESRVRYKYGGVALLTSTSIRNIFTDTECVLQKLRSRYGADSKWGTIPPGYASEMGWPKKAVELFDKKKKC